MFTVGDKLKENWTMTIYTIRDYFVSIDMFELIREGVLWSYSSEELKANFTKVDSGLGSPADSSGLYGVDDSSKWDAWADKKDSHSPYKIDPVYNIPTSGNCKITLLHGFASNVKTSNDNYNYTPQFMWLGKDGVKQSPDPFAKIVTCECGSTKAYGKDCPTDQHSRWCPIYSSGETK